MRLSIVVLLSCVLSLLVTGCCSHLHRDHRHSCLNHPEPPFERDPGLPGPGLVLGTSDFDANGTVLIKLQVEDLAVYSGNEAKIIAWSGNGEPPQDASQIPPPNSTKVYDSHHDKYLRHWTTHLDRTFEPVDDQYWLFVEVDHDIGGGYRDVVHLWWEWTPSSTQSPDTPHDFNQY